MCAKTNIKMFILDLGILFFFLIEVYLTYSTV